MYHNASVSRITFRLNRCLQEALQDGDFGVDTTPVVTTIYVLNV